MFPLSLIWLLLSDKNTYCAADASFFGEFDVSLMSSTSETRRLALTCNSIAPKFENSSYSQLQCDNCTMSGCSYCDTENPYCFFPAADDGDCVAEGGMVYADANSCPSDDDEVDESMSAAEMAIIICAVVLPVVATTFCVLSTLRDKSGVSTESLSEPLASSGPIRDSQLPVVAPAYLIPTGRNISTATSAPAIELRESVSTVGSAYNLDDLVKGGFTPAQLREAGFTAAELKIQGFSAAQLREANYPVNQLKRAGFTAAELREAGYTAIDLLLNPTQTDRNTAAF
jgi:hypothetical protein